MYLFAMLVYETCYAAVAAIIVGTIYLFLFLLMNIVDLPFPNDYINSIFLMLFFGFMLLASYRSKLAADIFTGGSYNWLEAHRTSGIILKSQLALLPFIGRFFQKSE